MLATAKLGVRFKEKQIRKTQRIPWHQFTLMPHTLHRATDGSRKRRAQDYTAVRSPRPVANDWMETIIEWKQ